MIEKYCVVVEYSIEGNRVTVPYYAGSSKAAAILKDTLRMTQSIRASNLPDIVHVCEPFPVWSVR